MRDPSTESVQAFQDLLEESESSPWYLNAIRSDLGQAVKLSEEIETLESVAHAITLASYVPEDQEQKLEILADIAFLLDMPPRDEGEHERALRWRSKCGPFRSCTITWAADPLATMTGRWPGA